MTRHGTALLLYHRPTHGWYRDAATVREHLHAFKRYSRFPVWEINTDYGFPPRLDDVAPAAIFLHYSLFGSGVYHFDERLLDWLSRQTSAFKVAFFQDEYYFCQKRFGFVNDFDIDVVYTHVAPDYIPEVWGRYAPKARAIFNLPGYVDDDMLAAARRFSRPDAQRVVDVGYRGRPLPAHMGAGSQEKRIIGERFRSLAEGSCLRVDIETSIEGRLYGDDWYRLLGGSRATLGVESGVSFIDLEDECHAEYLRLLEGGHEPTLEELQAGALGRWDGNIPYRTIGPRHFEAAAFRVCQVLYEGEYSGLMQPHVHYVPLAKDFTNFDEVVDALKDTELCGAITDRAYDDLIASGRYSYAAVVSAVDEVLSAPGLVPEATPTDRERITIALRRGRHRLRFKRWRERTAATTRHLVFRVVAPVSARVRRLLGLPIPSS